MPLEFYFGGNQISYALGHRTRMNCVKDRKRDLRKHPCGRGSAHRASIRIHRGHTIPHQVNFEPYAQALRELGSNGPGS